MNEQMDLLASMGARDEGVRRVTRQEFQQAGMEAIMALPSGWVGDAQDIRALIAVRPHHVNGWGALILCAVRGGWLVATGEYRKARVVASHARKLAVYRRT